VAGESQARGHADHPGLGDAEIERAPRVLPGEARGHGGLGQIGVERDDSFILGAQLDQRLPERGARGLRRHHFFPSADSSAMIDAAHTGAGLPAISWTALQLIRSGVDHQL
jgi:hypothetical protein